MSDLLVVLPVIRQEDADRCIDSILRPDSSLGIPPEQVLIVDNSRGGLRVGGMEVPYWPFPFQHYRDPDGHNLGVARAWNVGARRVLEGPAEYLVICSTSMRFGPALHTTWREQMDRFWGERVIECDGHSWHLIAFHRSVFEKIGLFDENFYPAYEEALDFSFRMRQVGWEGGWRRAWVNAVSATIAGHINMISCPWGPLGAYYAAKWGGPKGSETHSLPFGDKPLDWWEPATVPELAERYGLEVWW